MLSFAFEKPLFEFAYDRPHCEPLFALLPTMRSSTIYYLFRGFQTSSLTLYVPRKKKVV